MLGIIYFTGDVVPKNYPKAVMWFERAASHGSRKAMKMLALMYRKGVFVSFDEEKAEEWEEKARDI